MSKVLSRAAVLIGLLLAGGCADDRFQPAAPSGPPPPQPEAQPNPVPVPAPTPGPAPAPVVTGEIAMISVDPAPGAVFEVDECIMSFPAGVSRLCAKGWRGTFDVIVDQDMVRGVLTVGFYEGTTMCAYAAMDSSELFAGRKVRLSPSMIYLSWENYSPAPRTVQPCSVPVTTTRMVATLWSDKDHYVAFEREFAGSYTFVRR